MKKKADAAEKARGVRVKFGASMCRNCACAKRDHADGGGCFLHLYCEKYAPLGRKMLAALLAPDDRSERRAR